MFSCVGNKIRLLPYFSCNEDDTISWTRRDVSIKNGEEIVFKQDRVEFPEFWSDSACVVVADKYFRIINGVRESSLKTLCERVVNTIAQWGVDGGYFNRETAEIFKADLKFLVYNQYYAFNSPVWFNVGIDKVPQASACFINSVEDDMSSIMDLAKTEAMIFKSGSGSGTNFSRLRQRDASLTGGGRASGPVSFMKGYDAFAGVIKSGGKTRRAAKSAILDINHPDILEFIECKFAEDQKAKVLVANGYDTDFNEYDSAYSSIAFQNENHSIRVFDDFMEAVKTDDVFNLVDPRTNKVVSTIKARSIFKRICECAWECGDPGLQFSGTINKYNTIPKYGEIRASNPCSEFLSVDDTACNLGSLNLIRFISRTKNSYSFDTDSFNHATMLAALAQEIIVDRASYPTSKITDNVHKLRQLGVGFSNLGATLMYCGHPYDSSEGRSFAASVASLMTASVYYASTLMASIKGPFTEFDNNKIPMSNVLEIHRDNNRIIISKDNEIKRIRDEALLIWNLVKQNFDFCGIRNSQATLLAPTGTIGLMMDCDTTGVEPEMSLIKEKKLVGGGSIKIVNRILPFALENLGYNDQEIKSIIEYLNDHHEIEKCKLLKKEHVSIFDCALRAGEATRTIQPDGHTKMLAAIQPHISGGISKTVNLPATAKVEDIWNIFLLAYDIGVKSITVYRDGSKASQPLNVRGKEEKEKEVKHIKRHKMPDERDAKTHKFTIGGTYTGYLTAGFYPDGTLGEIFIESAKAGSTMNGLLDCFALAISIGLQHGVPLRKFIDKFMHVSFAPQGYTKNANIGYARSIPDYIFRFLEKFDKAKEEETIVEEFMKQPMHDWTKTMDAPPCTRCGAIMVRSGTCYRCEECGASDGCG